MQPRPWAETSRPSVPSVRVGSVMVPRLSRSRAGAGRPSTAAVRVDTDVPPSVAVQIRPSGREPPSPSAEQVGNVRERVDDRLGLAVGRVEGRLAELARADEDTVE